MRCSYCSRDAIYFQRHSGKHLCRRHFTESILRRVKRNIRKFRMINRDERVAIAMSGGKDSVVLAHMLKRLYGDRRDIELVAISIDEGIVNYRAPTLEIARKICRELDIEHYVVSFEDEFNASLDTMVEKGERNPCTYCGVFRKYLLNRKAREINADKLATGHNLDDEAQTILLNFLQSDIERLARLVPSKVQKGLVPRIKPMRELYEQEIVTYAILHNLPVSFEECPYSETPVRAAVRDFLYDFENRYPGRKFSVLRSFEAILPCLHEKYPQISLNECKICGEPTPREICQACELKRELDLS